MRVLLVEDERDMASWLVRALAQSGFVPDHAADARAALQDHVASTGSVLAQVVSRADPGDAGADDDEVEDARLRFGGVLAVSGITVMGSP